MVLDIVLISEHLLLGVQEQKRMEQLHQVHLLVLFQVHS